MLLRQFPLWNVLQALVLSTYVPMLPGGRSDRKWLDYVSWVKREKGYLQCDQIWQNSATLAIFKFYQVFDKVSYFGIFKWYWVIFHRSKWLHFEIILAKFWINHLVGLVIGLYSLYRQLLNSFYAFVNNLPDLRSIRARSAGTSISGALSPPRINQICIDLSRYNSFIRNRTFASKSQIYHSCLIEPTTALPKNFLNVCFSRLRPIILKYEKSEKNSEKWIL